MTTGATGNLETLWSMEEGVSKALFRCGYCRHTENLLAELVRTAESAVKTAEVLANAARVRGEESVYSEEWSVVVHGSVVFRLACARLAQCRSALSVACA